MFGLIRRPGRALAAVCVVTFAAAPVYAQTPATPKPEQKAADTANLPSARTIIDKHIDAIGGRKALAGHKSARLTGTMSMPANGMTGKLQIQTARPNKSVMKLTIEGVGDIEEGFDGTRGWSVSPMTGPMLTTGTELEERKFDSDFDSGLRDDARYEYMKTVEKTTFEGRPVYKVVLKPKGRSSEDIEYYDVETGLKAGGEVTRNSPMGAVSVVSIQSDYKKFGDVLQPTMLKQKVMGIEQIMTFTTIEYDTVDPSAFEIPAAVKALIK
jgi:hypothetical protein